MGWRAKCYQCEQEVGITVPVFEGFDLVEWAHWTPQKNLERAEAFYEAHPRSADTRPCDGAGKAVPKVRMRGAYSTTPAEDTPNIRHIGARRPKSN